MAFKYCTKPRLELLIFSIRCVAERYILISSIVDLQLEVETTKPSIYYLIPANLNMMSPVNLGMNTVFVNDKSMVFAKYKKITAQIENVGPYSPTIKLSQPCGR